MTQRGHGESATLVIVGDESIQCGHFGQRSRNLIGITIPVMPDNKIQGPHLKKVLASRSLSDNRVPACGNTEGTKKSRTILHTARARRRGCAMTLETPIKDADAHDRRKIGSDQAIHEMFARLSKNGPENRDVFFITRHKQDCAFGTEKPGTAAHGQVTSSPQRPGENRGSPVGPGGSGTTTPVSTRATSPDSSSSRAGHRRMSRCRPEKSARRHARRRSSRCRCDN